MAARHLQHWHCTPLTVPQADVRATRRTGGVCLSGARSRRPFCVLMLTHFFSLFSLLLIQDFVLPSTAFALQCTSRGFHPDAMRHSSSRSSSRLLLSTLILRRSACIIRMYSDDACGRVLIARDSTARVLGEEFRAGIAIFVIEHSLHGTTALVVNRPTPLTLSHLDLPRFHAFGRCRLFYGGEPSMPLVI